MKTGRKRDIKNQMALTPATKELVALIITEQAMCIRECEIQKEVLAKNHSLVVLNAFCRLD